MATTITLNTEFFFKLAIVLETKQAHPNVCNLNVLIIPVICTLTIDNIILLD